MKHLKDSLKIMVWDKNICYPWSQLIFTSMIPRKQFLVATNLIINLTLVVEVSKSSAKNVSYY